MKKILSLLAVSAMLFFVGCNKEVEPGTDPGTDPGETPVTPGPDPIQIDYNILTDGFCMSVGRQIDIAPFIVVEKLEDLDITSSSPDVVEVTSDMKFLAKQVGSSTISVKAGDKKVDIDIEVENSALMYCEDVFFITGRGLVLTGSLNCGSLKENEPVLVFNTDELPDRETCVKGLEFNKNLITEATYETGAIGVLTPLSKGMVQKGAALVSKDAKATSLTNYVKAVVTSVNEGLTLTPGTPVSINVGTIEFDAVYECEDEAGIGLGSVVKVAIDEKRVAAYVGETINQRVSGQNVATLTIIDIIGVSDMVPVPEYKLELTKESMVLAPNQTISLMPYLSMANIDLDNVEVTSTSSSILTVDKKSMSFTTVGAGKANVTLSFQDLSATLHVEVENTFVASVTDVFSITSRGIVLTGLPLSGTLNVNDPVYILNYKTGLNHYDTQIVGIEKSRKEVASISAGDGEAGLLLPSAFTDRTAFARGGVIMAKDTKRIQPATVFKGTISLKSKDEGGRISPVMVNYMPEYSVGGGAIKVKLTDLAGEEMLMPGETYYGCTFEVQNGDLLLSYIGQELVYSTDGITITVTDVTPVTVSYTSPAAASLSMYTTSGTIAVDDYLDLMDFIVSENIDFSKVTVSSSATDVATAKMASDYKSIEVAALKAGTTTVTVASGSLSASIALTVEDSFCMPIEATTTITGRGTLASGSNIETGTINVSDLVDIDPTSTSVDASALKGIAVVGISVLNSQVEYASSGEPAGLLLRGITKDQLAAGYVIHTPGSKRNVITSKFALNVKALTKDEGGLDSYVLAPGTSSTIYVNSTSFTATTTSDSPSISAGKQGIVTVELAEGTQATLSLGKTIVFRESSRTVATATVVAIL